MLYNESYLWGWDLFQHIQYELLEDFTDAHGEGLAVHSFAEVAHANQLYQLPHTQALLFETQLHLVVFKLFLDPATSHGLRQLAQEILNLWVKSVCIKMYI